MARDPRLEFGSDPVTVTLPRNAVAFLRDLIGGSGPDFWGRTATHYGLSTADVQGTQTMVGGVYDDLDTAAHTAPRCVSCGGDLVQQGDGWVHGATPGCDALIVPEGLRLGVDVLLDHIAEHHPEVKGLVVSQAGPLNDQVAEMVAKGWAVERVEYVAGKRVRIMRPPAGETADAETHGGRSGATPDYPAPRPRCAECGSVVAETGGVWHHEGGPARGHLAVPGGVW